MGDRFRRRRSARDDRDYDDRVFIDPDAFYRRPRRSPSPANEINLNFVNEGGRPDNRRRPTDDYDRPPRFVPVPVAVPGGWPAPQSPPLGPPPDDRRDRSRSRGRYDSEEERRRIIEEYEWEKAKEEQRRKDAIREAELRRKEEEEERKRAEKVAVEKYREKQREEERRGEEAQREYERRVEEAQKEFERKRKEKAQKARDEAAAQDALLKDRLAKALHTLKIDDDLSPAAFDKLLDGKKLSANEIALITPSPPPAPAQPTWSRVKRSEISKETLKYYDLDYYTDPGDSGWLIIRRELNQREIDVLFEHTRRERAKEGGGSGSGSGRGRQERLEARKDGGLVLVRQPSRSKSRERSRNRNVSGAERFAGALLKFAG